MEHTEVETSHHLYFACRSGQIKVSLHPSRPSRRFVPASERYPASLQRNRQESRLKRQAELLALQERACLSRTDPPPQHQEPRPCTNPASRVGGFVSTEFWKPLSTFSLFSGDGLCLCTFWCMCVTFSGGVYFQHLCSRQYWKVSSSPR